MYRVTYSTVLSYIIRLTHHRYYQLLMEVIIKLISSEIETCIIDISSVCLNIKEKKEFSLGHWCSTIPLKVIWCPVEWIEPYQWPGLNVKALYSVAASLWRPLETTSEDNESLIYPGDALNPAAPLHCLQP